MKIQVEGWQNIPHAFAIANQFLLAELLKRSDLTVSFQSVPYSHLTWQSIPSLSDLKLTRIPRSSFPSETAEMTLRMYEPLNLNPSSSQRTLIWSETEWGFLRNAQRQHLGIKNFNPLQIHPNIRLITPSQWSKQGLLRSGLNEDQITVIPLGVDPQLYHPLSSSERTRLRQQLGWDQYCVFLHISRLADAAGIRPLLKAFAQLVERYPDARLVLKGGDDLHTSQKFLATASRMILTEAEVARIKPRIAYIGETLTFQRLAQFYQAADAYVSPYLASSFNLPVLEAMACGLPVICTDGGATDDFVHPELTLKINSQFRAKFIEQELCFFYHPDWEHLVELMETVLKKSSLCTTIRQTIPQFVRENYTWKQTVNRLLAVFQESLTPPSQLQPPIFTPLTVSSHSLRVQGWRSIPHSYALINSYQLLELVNYPQLDVYHQDMPYVTNDWKATSGLLSLEAEERLNQIPKIDQPEAVKAEVTLRVYCPFNLATSLSQRTYMFGCTEWGFIPQSILRGMGVSSFREAHFASDTVIITASHWSKQGFINSGADPQRVKVIPLGYDPEIYSPLSEAQRLALRQKMNWQNHFIFLNIGVMWNERQGIDKLLKAFAILSEFYPHIRLVLKGRDAIFPSKQSIQTVGQIALTDAEYERIKPKIGYIGQSLSSGEMAELYQAADCYVSPYAAEGFNLPVLEAMACGLPVICTAGGPTDDFTPTEWVWKIESQLKVEQLKNRDLKFLLEPHQDHLIQLMKMMIEQPNLRMKVKKFSTKYVAERYTWKQTVKRLVEVMFESGWGEGEVDD